MKRTFCLLCCLLLMAAFGVPARAESGCWYLYTYGAHDFEQTEMRLPTCTEAGYFLLECRICGHNELHMTDSAIGHDWQRVDNESFSPTCTQAGITTWVCDECSLKRTESVKELGHDMRDEAVVRSPTCEIEGRMSIRCSRCGYSGGRDIPRTDHQYGAWRVTVPATDHSMGTRQSVCIECGGTQNRNYFPDGTLTRGSKGEAVRSLQQMLFDLGILRDVADGVFGAKTESAVKNYQTTVGFNSDGIAWPQTRTQLELDWQQAMGLGPASTQAPKPAAVRATATPSPKPAPAETTAPIPVCRLVLDENGAERFQYCDYHQGIADMAASLLAAAGETNAQRAQKQIRALWETEMEGLYDEWLQGVPEDEQAAIAASRATFVNYLTVQETALKRRFGTETAARQINAVLELQCVTLCNMLHDEQ